MFIKKYKLIFQIFIVFMIVIALSALTLLIQSPQSFLENGSAALINISISEINKLEITNQKNKEVLIKKDRRWYVLRGTTTLLADSHKMESLLTELELLTRDQEVEKPNGTLTSIKINGDGLEVLIFSNKSGNYVSLRGESSTYISRSGVTSLSDSLDFRNLWLINSKAPMLSYKVYAEDSEVLSMKFENEQWMVVKPLKVQVSREIGLKFTETFAHLKGEDIALGVTELQAGLVQPKKRIELANQDQNITIFIGNYRPSVAGGTPGYYAKVNGDDRIVILSEDTMNSLPFSLQDINDLRKIKY